MKEAGAKRALVLPVGGAFHSVLMKPAEEELAAAIEQTAFHKTVVPCISKCNHYSRKR